MLWPSALAALGGAVPGLVVDNSSSPATAAVVRSAGARYVDPGANLGFAAAVNLALAHLADPARDVLLLNPDARIDARRNWPACTRSSSPTPTLACVAPAQHVPGSDGPEPGALAVAHAGRGVGGGRRA